MTLDYTRHYRRWHNDSPEHFARMERYFGGRLAPHLPADLSASILDVGCGMGFALRTLRARGFTALAGVDSDHGQAASASAHDLAVVHTADVPAWLRSRPAHYHVILLLDVLEHVPVAAQIDLLSAICGALVPDGKLLCSVPNASSTVATRQRYVDWTHCTAFTEHSLDFALGHGGFREITILPDDGPARRLPWLPLWRRRWWYVRSFFRAVRRLQLMAELGAEEGRLTPLSANLLAVAKK